MNTDRDGCIGILCSPDQPVFANVATRLRSAGHSVRFLDPQSELPASRVDDLVLIVNKQVFPVTLPALRYAQRTGTPLWNGLALTIALSSRLVGLNALESVGFRTPAVTFEQPDGEYVSKTYYVWDGEPELNGEGDFYQELIPTEPIDWKYYAVDRGDDIQTAGRRVTSKLYGPKRFLDEAPDRPVLTSRLRRLVQHTRLRGVGIDLVRDHENRFWAVDINLAAGYRDTGLDPALFESIRSSLPLESQ